jgi:RNA polymerase sigma factor (sigma-70 family)
MSRTSKPNLTPLTLRKDSGPSVKERETDAALFAALAPGNLGPLGVLFDRYHEDVRQFFFRAAPRGNDIDDLVQETFLTVARAAQSYDGRENARPFLIGVAAQLLRRRRRTFARLKARLEAFSRVAPNAPRTPEESASTKEQHEALLAAVERLSDDRRIVLVMVEWNGMSGVEVARALDVPVGTIWRRLHEARNELKAALEGGAS